ncbi:MAG: S8 family serine peptidase [Bacteroidia bacterium]
MRITLILIFTSLTFFKVSAQNNYWIFFNPAKGDTSPVESVNKSYLKKIANKNIKIIGTSKWFNAAYISVYNSKELKKIEKLSFVKNIEQSRKYHVQKSEIQLFDSLNYGQADVQLNMLGLQNYHRQGNTGKGVIIALFDAGFLKVDSIKAFDSLRKQNRILATRDFYDNNPNVYDDDAHGMMVLSLISGYVKDSLNGSAPDAKFVLARSENVTGEKHIEEFNWVRALEWADSIGVDIIHSSLGYSEFDSLEGNYTYKDMDGQSTIITRAAEMAFARGIFITNSAGNEGEKPWHYITAPCDGKNVLCIGAVDSFERHARFSSYGPSSDKRIKPDVMAMGHRVTIIGNNNNMRRGSGTSFSGPIIAGFVACLKQTFPKVDNKILLDAIRKSGHLYKTPNDSMGYGIPNINKADSLVRLKLSTPAPSKLKFKIYPNPCYSFLNIETNGHNESVEITDVLGKIYYREIENNYVDMSGFNPGIYFLRIGDLGVERIVKI